jgi:hypothetical protein
MSKDLMRELRDTLSIATYMKGIVVKEREEGGKATGTRHVPSWRKNGNKVKGGSLERRRRRRDFSRSNVTRHTFDHRTNADA